MSDWQTYPLGDLIENLDTRRVPIKEADRRRGPYPYYGASGVVDYVDSFRFEGLHLLIAEDGENLRTRRLPIAFLANGKFWVNNHAHVVRGNNKSDTRFLLYALLTADIASYLTGSTMPKLTQGNLNRILILAPEREEQLRIAGALGALDDKIELNRRMNETLEATARAIFRDWFVDFGPTNAKMEGREPYLPADLWSLFPDMIDEALNLPEGWRRTSLSGVADTYSGGTPSKSASAFWGGAIPWISPKVMNDIHAWDSDERVTAAAVGNGTRLARSGSVLVMVRGMGLHDGVRISQARRDVTFNQDVKALIARSVPDSFLLFGLLDASGFLFEGVESSGHGTGVLPSGRLERVQLNLPPDGPLREMSQVLDDLNEKIALNSQESRTLAETRDYLLPKLMSGEMRIQDVEKIAEAAA